MAMFYIYSKNPNQYLKNDITNIITSTFEIKQN